MSNDVIDEFNSIIKAYGIKSIYLTIKGNNKVKLDENSSVYDDMIYMFFHPIDKDELLYSWRSIDDFLNGSDISYSIFELCHDLMMTERECDIFKEDGCFEFCELVSGCETFDEIKLKMQLCGYKI